MRYFGFNLKYLAKIILRKGLSCLNRYPKLRKYALSIVNILGLRRIARALYARVTHGVTERGVDRFIPTDLSHLTPSGQRIYAALKDAIDRKKEVG